MVGPPAVAHVARNLIRRPGLQACEWPDRRSVVASQPQAGHHQHVQAVQLTLQNPVRSRRSGHGT